MSKDPINDGIAFALDAIRDADKRHRAFVSEVSAVVSVMDAVPEAARAKFAAIGLERIAAALRTLRGKTP